MDIFEQHLIHKEEIQDLDMWFDQEYQSHFGEYFSEARKLFERLQSKSQPITDEELSWILSTLPIKLFQVSEALNRYRLATETVKIAIKRAKKRNDELVDVLGDELLVSAMSCIISAVEGEVSFSRELIMGAKKIWDSRRMAEQSMPVSESATLPEYKVPSGKAYVK